MTWQRRPYVPGALWFPSRSGRLREWGIRLERHDTARILVLNLGSWIYMKSFRKTPSAGAKGPDHG